jgi:hypothetical protein
MFTFMFAMLILKLIVDACMLYSKHRPAAEHLRHPRSR